jgi:molybdopterin molybdotransferase
LAAVGIAEVPAYPRPSVGILTTGNELRPPGTRLQPGKIYESNGPLLQALVKQAGAQAMDLGSARDTLASLIRKVHRGLTCDLLVISGGVSVGEKDFVRKAAQRCGIRPLLWQVNIKPGMPLFVGTHRPACRDARGAGRRTLVFGLPGNPVSVFVTFEEFVKPALYRLMGRKWKDPYAEPAVLTDELRVSHTRRTHFLRVRCFRHHPLVAEPLDGQGSHRLGSLVEADGWIRVASGKSPRPAGTQVFVKRESPRW